MAKAFRMNRELLINEIRDRRDQAKARFEKDRDAYPKLFEKWMGDTISVLEKASAAVEKGKSPVKRGHGSSLPLPGHPKVPDSRDYVAGFDRVLDYLGKVASDTLTIDQETYERMTSGRR